MELIEITLGLSNQFLFLLDATSQSKKRGRKHIILVADRVVGSDTNIKYGPSSPLENEGMNICLYHQQNAI